MSKKKVFVKKNYSRKTFIENKNFFSISDQRFEIKINIIQSNFDEIFFQIKGFDLYFQNALRRILLGEITTMSIEKVNFYDNSSIINDEIISQRLGLVPIFIPSEFIDFLIHKGEVKILKIFLGLNVIHPNNTFDKISIYSKSLKWKKYGIFKAFFKNISVKPVFKDILIAKLNPGQKIDCECECILGFGNTNAKFSPVGTTFYKLFPQIRIISEITEKDAHELLKKCPVRVFDLEKTFFGLTERLIVSHPQFCTFCKECLDLGGEILPKIKIGRSKEKFTFIIEATGILAPEVLFHRAIFLLVGKCNQSLLTLFKNFKKNLIP